MSVTDVWGDRKAKEGWRGVQLPSHPVRTKVMGYEEKKASRQPTLLNFKNKETKLSQASRHREAAVDLSN